MPVLREDRNALPIRLLRLKPHPAPAMVTIMPRAKATPQISHPQADPSARTWLAIPGLAGLGLVLWAHDFAWDRKHIVQIAAMAAAAILSLIPVIHRSVFALLDRIRRPSPRSVRLATLALIVGSAYYFIYTGMRQERELIPKMHDEFMHLIQAQLMAHGRLWLPAHPMADFFETFHVFVKPKYAPIYFPGTSLLYVPAIWLGLAPWVMAALICGGIVGMTYRVFTELIDGVAGALAAVMALGLPTIHELSLMTTSHAPMLLAGLLLTWAYLQWRRETRLRWAVALGAIAGWAAIVRPLDALCFLVPMAVAMVLDLRRAAPPRKQGLRHGLRTFAVCTCAAAPFLALQLILDYGVTGHLLETPASRYAQINWPAASLFYPARDPAHHPPSHLPQFRQFYYTFVVRDTLGPIERNGALNTWLMTRIPTLFRVTLPSCLLLFLLPAGLSHLTDRPRRLVVAALPLFLVAYGCFPPFLPYYTLLTAPAIFLLVLLGGQVVEDAFPARRPIVATLVALAVLAASLTCLSELNPGLRDPNVYAPILADVYQKLHDDLDFKPAVVLFHFDYGDDANQEPVYNWETPNPDDAEVIRAQDLGPRDVELFDYYAHHGPPRMFYLYDRTTATLRKLGMAADLARNLGKAGTQP